MRTEQAYADRIKRLILFHGKRHPGTALALALQAPSASVQYWRMSNSKPIILYPFKVPDERTGKWRRTRYKASLEEVERLGGEVCGEPVIFQSLGSTSDFLRDSVAAPIAVIDSVEMHPHWESPPAIDPLERFLAQTFLRRYVTWCVRKRRFAVAQGAAALYRELV